MSVSLLNTPELIINFSSILQVISMLASVGKLCGAGAQGLLKILPEIIYPNLVERVENTHTWTPTAFGRYKCMGSGLIQGGKSTKNKATLLCLKPWVLILDNKNSDLDMQGGQLCFCPNFRFHFSTRYLYCKWGGQVGYILSKNFYLWPAFFI